MKPNPSLISEQAWSRTLACMAAALLLFYMVCPVAPLRWNDLYLAYGKTLIIAMAALYFFVRGMRGVVEVRLVLWYAIWVFVTRLLNTDWYLQNELDLVISRFLCAVILPVGLLLKGKDRERLLDVVIAVAGAFYFVTALLGLYACVFGVYFYLPPEHVVFGLDNEFFGNTFMYVIAWETNRTISAVWFYLAWCMMAYEFFHCKNKLWRIPIGLAWLVFHLTIAFCFCRSIKLAVCVNVAMLLILWMVKALPVRTRALKAAVIAILAVLSMGACYKSFDLLTSATAAVYNAMDVQVERTSDVFMGDRFRDRTQNGQDFRDTRNVSESVSNISNRGEIYRSVLPTLREDPLRLAIGKYSSKLMDGPRKYLSYPYFHMHNFLLQVLMLTGLLGFGLVAAFCILLVVRMVRLFFSDHPAATTAVKALTLPLAGIFIYGMFETILFTASADNRALTDFRELFFFLVAGIILGYYYDVFPQRKK